MSSNLFSYKIISLYASLFFFNAPNTLAHRIFAHRTTLTNKNLFSACIRLHANVIGHVDLRPYVYLLTSIRDSERALGRDSSLADALSPTDLRHLVVDIWHGRSVLSERSDPRELRLPCYDDDEPWSPWNCVLLTEDETEAYCDGVDSFLADNLKRKIRLAHHTARMDFRLDWVSESFGKGRWGVGVVAFGVRSSEKEGWANGLMRIRHVTRDETRYWKETDLFWVLHFNFIN